MQLLLLVGREQGEDLGVGGLVPLMRFGTESLGFLRLLFGQRGNFGLLLVREVEPLGQLHRVF